ncbi:hypothetical protein [Pseudolactococcus insecticola]|uniref:DUF5648 domain-containing protein n=1 Tax=Pseudolactococcus insecticola TaxID=2709158 RepID=A0A6A0BA96_9LACT|nr:hypothetical protein [Lactococcus insecticola]GFH41294.1 hypothetical protein Hs20B_16920 [Lactococcus insecticola]
MKTKNKLLEKIQKTTKKHRIIASALAVLLIGASLLIGSTQTSATTTAVPTTQPMYRLYNAYSGEHFYTASTAERNSIIRGSWQWYYEGISWFSPTHSNTPVYRLYNKNAGDHHYTISKDEKDMLVKKGWRYEGIGWYSDDKKTIKVLRAYNKNAKAGSHNYTTSDAEQQNLIKNGWRNEGIGWYAAGAGKALDPVADSGIIQESNENKQQTNYLINKRKNLVDEIANDKKVAKESPFPILRSTYSNMAKMFEKKLKEFDAENPQVINLHPAVYDVWKG